MPHLPIPRIPSHGASIPVLGVGTAKLQGEIATRTVAEALRLGIRHVDTARRYGNEAAIGEGMRQAGIARGELFISSRIWWEDLAADRLQQAAEAALTGLGVNDLDLLMIHWPNPDVPLADTLQAMARLKRRGLAKHIGVSNFPSHLLDQAMALSSEPIVCNQIEFHPYLDQARLLAACRRHGIAVVAYSPLAGGKVVVDPVIGAIARRHGKSSVQTALRWLVQQGDVAVVPTTSKSQRLAENVAIFDFALSDDDMRMIGSLTRPDGRDADPVWHPIWD